MASFVEILGDKLVSKSGTEDAQKEVATADALKGKKAVALYFSAHWCPPCRSFTPEFAEWYTNDLQAKGLEVVFVSSDQDEDQFKGYHGEQPWLALPYADREKKEALSEKYKVQGIPSVVILGPDGSLISKNGRAVLKADPTGEDMPWTPKSFRELFSNAKLLGPGGKECLGSSLENKVLALYFSAHWCPPCRGFTPKFAEWYKKDLEGKGLEVVFVSSDKGEAEFKEYFAEQPWFALDYADRKLKEKLSDLFEVGGIPTVVILDADGSVISKDGRAAIGGDPTGQEFPWYPKPVSNLKQGAGNLNEVPTVIAFCQAADAATQKSVEDAMVPLATKLQAEAKAKKEDPKLAFLIVTDKSGLAARIRDMLQLPVLAPSKHEHPLEKSDSKTGWGCDGCSASGEGKERFRCDECDFDFCGECKAKAESGEVETLPPKLMLLDIPDKGGFYEGPEGDLTADVLEKFVADYVAKKLQRQQLQG